MYLKMMPHFSTADSREDDQDPVSRREMCRRSRSTYSDSVQKLMQGKVSLMDCIFAKEYRGMKGYKPGACVSCSWHCQSKWWDVKSYLSHLWQASWEMPHSDWFVTVTWLHGIFLSHVMVKLIPGIRASYLSCCLFPKHNWSSVGWICCLVIQRPGTIWYQVTRSYTENKPSSPVSSHLGSPDD